MKKTKLLAIPVLAAVMLTGCASTPAATNKAPSVVGVKDIQCMVNSTVDFLDGVAALDNEDGDITPALEITVTPEVEVNNGYAYFTEVGEYTVNYKVTDSDGRTAQKRAYVDVVDRETYKTFAMPEGFSVTAEGSATIEKSGMENGKFKLEAKDGEIAEDVKLTRTYSLPAAYSTTDYVQYTFKYTVNSDVAGKIKAMADGEDCAELSVHEGENVLAFTHTVKKSDEVKEVTVDICLGSLGDVKWTIEKVEIEYPQEEGALKELAEDFNFAGRVDPRFDPFVKDGAGNVIETLPIDGNAWPENGGAAARLQITQTCNEIWRGGMFINTGVILKAGVTYTVSFNVERDEENDFEIIIQRDQWTEYKIKTLFTPVGKVTEEITADANSAGALWIYVQSGTAKNQITLSELSVKEHLGAVGKDTFSIDDFTMNQFNGGAGTFTTANGGFEYTVTGFGVDSNTNEVTSPSFLIAGSGANYVITFKAKATAPIEMIIISPVFGGWEPTILWQRINLTEEETVYTFFCNGNGSDRLYRIVWQFGSASNQQFNNVKIEISDIKVSLKNNSLDG